MKPTWPSSSPILYWPNTSPVGAVPAIAVSWRWTRATFPLARHGCDCGLASFREFLETPLDDLLAAPQSASTPEENVVALFHDVARTVPAYQGFLREHDVAPEAIRTFADFQTLPMVTKENYLGRHPL